MLKVHHQNEELVEELEVVVRQVNVQIYDVVRLFIEKMKTTYIFNLAAITNFEYF